MVKYTTIDAVLNYLPGKLLNQVDTGQVRSWVYQAYRMFEYMPEAEEMKTATIAINQHKAVLPDNLKRILSIKYSSLLPPFQRYEIEELDQDKLLVYQKIFFDSDYWLSAKPLRYRGQMRVPIINEDLYCSECAVGFTIDSSLTCLTIDHADGQVLLVYSVAAEKDGEPILPDDTHLLMGLSHFVQAQYWNEMTYSHEANSVQLSQQHLLQAVELFNRYRGKRMGARINPVAHNEFVFRRNPQPKR